MPDFKIRSRDQIAEEIFSTVGGIYGTDNVRKEFAVEPTIVQELETKVKQSNEFLNRISTRGKITMKGQIIAMEGTKPLAKRTAVGRRPTDPTAFTDRSYENVPVEKDAVISWDKVDEWRGVTENGDIYTEYRDIVTHTMATDILRIGWNGQFHAATTDPDTHTQLQDVHQGWIQYMIENAPEQVIGITLDPTDPRGYTIDPIRIGKDASGNKGDFLTLDELVFHLRQRYIHRLFRRRGDLRVLLGDDLVFHENKKLFAKVEDPTEKNALQAYLNSQNFGRTLSDESDEFPERGLFLSMVANIERDYQIDSMRRKLNDDDQLAKGIVDYNYIREDYVIPIPEAAVVGHPDAFYLWDDIADAWMPAADSWKVGGTLRPDSTT
jgi:P2 family phage major capsid protein